MRYSQDPLVWQLRAGTSSDPYVSKSEPHEIIDGRILLSELPVRDNKVQITNYFEVINFTSQSALANNEYYVDYLTGDVFFNPSQNGTIVTATYLGRGLVYIPASRIYTKADVNGTIQQTLEDVVATATQFLHRGSYNPTTTYNTYNIVSYQGGTFMYTATASTSGNLPTDTTYWTKITGFQWRGTYSTSATYNAGDTVNDAALEVVYQSLVDNNTNQPLSDTTKWVKLVSVAEVIASAETAISNANTATINANNAASSANSAATNANNEAVYAQAQGDYAKSVGDSLIHRGDYDNATAYVVRNLVYYQGATYMCIADSIGNLPTNTVYWKKITNMIWRGTYSSTTTYNFGDTVVDSLNENIYICILDGTLNVPLATTTNWDLLVSVSGAISSANTATTNANNAASTANTAASNADTAANYAQTQGDYAKDVGDSLVNLGDYNDTTAYVVRNIVQYQGSTYMCILDSIGNLPTDATYWRKLTSYRWMGEYSSLVTYQYGDTVKNTENTSVYQCIVASSTDDALTDGNVWALIISVQDAVDNANSRADYAQTQGDYALAQGDYALAQGLEVQDLLDSYVYIGEYDNDVSYIVNNQVTYNGATYICIQNTLGNVPAIDSPYWRLFASGGEVIVSNYKNTVTLDADSNEVTIGIDVFNKGTDLLNVYQNSTYIEADQDYTISADGLKITKVSGTWAMGTVFNFIVLKNIPASAGDFDGNLIADGTITNDKLNDDIKVGSLATLTTADKTNVVGAINELDNEIGVLSGDTNNHINATTGVHGATSVATPNTIVMRNANGNVKSSTPLEDDDVIRKLELNAHLADTTAHGINVVKATADAALPKAGGTLTGNITVDPGGNSVRTIGINRDRDIGVVRVEMSVAGDNAVLFRRVDGNLAGRFEIVGQGHAVIDGNPIITSAGGQTINGSLGLNGTVQQLQFQSAGVTKYHVEGNGSAFVIAETGVASRLAIDSTGHLTLTSGVKISMGTGSPEGVVTAPVGSLYLRTDGGAATTFYVKESGTGNTGWIAK